MLQLGTGVAEGYVHSQMKLPPDVIHISNTPISELGYGTGQLIQNLVEDGALNSKSDIIQHINVHQPNNTLLNTNDQ